MTRVVYLHGFASSPSSSKARFFSQRLIEHGVEVEIPQLDEGDFPGMTLTRQLTVIERAVGARPAILMGSSLGGYLASLYAAGHRAVERVVMFAPAFHFPSRWQERFSGELERWEREGALPFFHFGSKTEQPLGYGFVEDAARYPDEPAFPQPALILHGTGDPVVPAALSRAYAAAHPNVTLRLLESGHELTDVLEPMWEEIAGFLGLREFQKS